MPKFKTIKVQVAKPGGLVWNHALGQHMTSHEPKTDKDGKPVKEKNGEPVYTNKRMTYEVPAAPYFKRKIKDGSLTLVSDAPDMGTAEDRAKTRAKLDAERERKEADDGAPSMK